MGKLYLNLPVVVRSDRPNVSWSLLVVENGEGKTNREEIKHCVKTSS
jgi:hypothetical protein